MGSFKEFADLFVKALTTPLFNIGGNTVTLSSLAAAGSIVVVSIFLSKATERLIRQKLSTKDIDRGIKGSIERFARYLVVLIGLFVAMDTVGVKLSSLAALGAVLMVGIGFGLQNITQNFISGIILLLERPVKQGDIIAVGDSTGKVLDIHVRSTVVLTRDDVALIIPNSQLVSEVVTNESFSADQVRIHVKVGVAYGSDTALVVEQLLKAAKENPRVIQDPKPVVIFENFGDSALEFDLRVWIADIWFKDVISSELRFAIDQAFRDQNIVIPFPQRDVHFKSYEAERPFMVNSDAAKSS